MEFYQFIVLIFLGWLMGSGLLRRGLEWAFSDKADAVVGREGCCTSQNLLGTCCLGG